MGLGKTVQAATALSQLAASGDVRRALVVAPRSLLTQWRRALEDWAPELSAIRVEGPFEERRWRWDAAKHVYLSSYETVRNDLAKARAHPWDLVVLDEAQRIKNRDSETSQAMKRLPRARSWALTGTPLENRVDELASILEFVAPNPDGARRTSLREGPRLIQLHAELQLRRRKEDVLRDLPPKTITQVDLELTAAQRRAYLKIESGSRDRLRELGEAATVMNVLHEITLLKQVCNFCPETGQSSKADDLRERLTEIAAADHRALVFSQWTNERFGAQRIAAILTPFRPLVFSGALSNEERDATIRRFADDRSHRALILSLRAGGQGLNLQEASYVVHFDRWWNPAVEDQATARAHRAGQEHPVTVYEYLCSGTIEERIEEVLCTKRAMFAAVVDGVSLDLSRVLSPTELFGLFGLPAPGRLRGAASGASLADRGQELLEASGWVVRRRPASTSSPVELRAEAGDGLGVRARLWVATAEPGRLADSIVALADARHGQPGIRAAVLSDEEPGDEERDLADRRAVEIWSTSRGH